MANNTRRITKELNDLIKAPPQGVSVTVNDQNILQWKVAITGPSGSLYEKGIYHLDVTFPPDYPYKPPSCVFNPILYHPSVSQEDGIACLPVISDKWSPTVKMPNVFEQIREMLANPDPSHAAAPSIAQEYAEQRETFVNKLNEWIQKNAMQ